jgi:demethylphylloquinol methyltransferase
VARYRVLLERRTLLGILRLTFDSYPYGRVSAIYDELAGLYSLGRIDSSKRNALEYVKPGDEVFFAGVGRGREAVLAAALGCRVLAIDLAPEMLERFRGELDRAGLDATAWVGDVSEYRSDEGHDVVVANYFLNLFDANRASGMLEILVRCVRPGGCLVISDFARPRAGALASALTALYYGPVNWIAWLMGFCALHPILDYAELLQAHGMSIQAVTRFPLCKRLGGISPAYISIVAKRET